MSPMEAFIIPPKPGVITVGGSHGEFGAYRDTGWIVDGRALYDGQVIVRVNLPEWKAYWGKELPKHFDILDLGYWIDKNGRIEYEEPAHDWREDVKNRSVFGTDSVPTLEEAARAVISFFPKVSEEAQVIQALARVLELSDAQTKKGLNSDANK